MFDQMATPSAPSGVMSPVETSSGTTISTRPSIVSGRGGTSGGGTMFVPFSSSTPLPSSGGAMNCPSVTDGSGLGSGGSSGGSPRSRGSVISPRSAVAAAVAGEQRYTRSPGVPLRPGKFRLKVRTETAPAAGAWPMPMHGPQAGSRIRAPEARASE